MYLEQRLEKIEGALALLLTKLEHIDRAQASVERPGGVVIVPEENMVCVLKAPDVAADRERIKQLLIGVKRAGGNPNAILAKAGFGRLSEIATAADVAKVDALLGD